MSRTKVAIYGAGHLGKQIYHHVHHHCANQVEFLGFIDDTRSAGEIVDGDAVTLGTLNDVIATQGLRLGEIQVVFAIGYANMPARHAALDRVLDAGYELYSVVHPRSVIEPGAQLGAGCIVFE